MRTFRNSADVTLTDNGTGKGTGAIRIAPAGRDWVLNYITVRCSSHANEAICSVYENYEGDRYLVDSTFTGSSGDTTDTRIAVKDGNALIIRWVGGDVGATATATWTGEET